MTHPLIDLEPGDIVHEPPTPASPEQVKGAAFELGTLRSRVEWQAAEISYLRKSRDAMTQERDAATKQSIRETLKRQSTDDRMRALEAALRGILGMNYEMGAPGLEMLEPFLGLWTTVNDMADMSGLTRCHVRAILGRHRHLLDVEVMEGKQGLKRYRMKP